MSVDRIIAEGQRTKRYAGYIERCREHNIQPLSFRRFAEIDDEYDREWEVAGYEYKREVKGNEDD